MTKLSRVAALILSFAFAGAALAQTTVTLQQGVNNYAGLTDSWILSTGPTQNRGTDGALSIRSESTDSAMVRFKIFAAEGGPVPDGASIASATLHLYKFGGPAAVLKASRLLKGWNETQVTWNVAATGVPWTTPGALSAGSDYVAAADGQASIGDAVADNCDAPGGGPFPAACWLHIDVTTGVRAFAANPAQNFGWKIAEVSSANPGSYKNLQSRDHPAFPATWPQLSVTYTTAPAGTTTLLQQGVNGYAGLTDSWILSAGPTQNRGTDGALSLRGESSDSGMVRFKIFAAEGGPIPNGATITSATLQLYKFQGPDAVLKASRLLKNWDEMQVTWNVAATGVPWTTPGALSAGNDYVATPDGQASVGDATANNCDAPGGGPFPAACWANINVTAGVQAFAANPASNFGWKIAQVSSSLPDSYKNLQSRDHPAFPGTWPRLSVTWTGGTGPAPTAQLSANPTSGQPGVNVTFNASASTDNGSPITGLRLVFGDGTPDAVWTDKNQTRTHTYNAVGNYTASLTVTNANGTSAPATRTITVTTGPVGPTAAFTATPQTGSEPLAVTFDASGSTQGSSAITSLRLQFGHLNQEANWSDKSVTQSHTYPAGTYTATLTVTDANNLTSSTTRTIQVDPVGAGEILPNVTSPAGNLGFSVPTFHSMSLYYNPASTPANCTTSNGAGCKIWMRYRKATEPNTAWRQGYPLWFDPRTTDGNSPATNTLPFTANGLTYRARGSAVLLQPNTKYFFEIGTGTSFAEASWQHYVAGTTWPETFRQDGATVAIPNTSGTCPASGPCVITQGGSAATGYKVYDGWNGVSKNVIDRGGAGTANANGVNDDTSHAIVVKASFVIIRNIRATGAAISGIYIAPNVTDVVIEDSQIDDWSWRPGNCCGEPNPNSWGTWGFNEAGAVWANGNNSRIVIQRNIIKEPHLGAFPWDTGTSCGARNHPIGPNGVSFQQGNQQNVVRYNEITGHPTDRHKWYLDGIGGGENISSKGSPGADSDIYQNIIMHVFDDAIEAEGGGRNVRVWGNYTSDTKTAVGATIAHFGPLYVWRNVFNRLRTCYQSVTDANPDGDWPTTAFKYAGWDTVQAGEGYGDGIRYLFHNTILQPAGSFGAGVGVENTANGSLSVQWTLARNNIFHVRNTMGLNTFSVDSGDTPTGSDFAFDVYNGRYQPQLVESTPAATFKFDNSGAQPQLYYKSGNGASSVPALGGNGTGNYQLDSGSKGLDVGQVLPNFSDGFMGSAPDAGAHENGAPPMKFGISAGQ